MAGIRKRASLPPQERPTTRVPSFALCTERRSDGHAKHLPQHAWAQPFLAGPLQPPPERLQSERKQGMGQETADRALGGRHATPCGEPGRRKQASEGIHAWASLSSAGPGPCPSCASHRPGRPLLLSGVWAPAQTRWCLPPGWGSSGTGCWAPAASCVLRIPAGT